MMESAGKVLFFATSFALLSRCRFGFPRSDLLRHHHRAVYATSEDRFHYKLCCGPVSLVRAPVGQESPNDPGYLVRLSHDGHVPVLCLEQLHQPRWLHPLSRSHGPGTVDNHAAQIGVAAFADTEQSNLATGATLPRHDAQPSGELPTGAELSSISYRSNDGRRRQRTDPRNGSQSSASLIAAFVGLKVLLERLD